MIDSETDHLYRFCSRRTARKGTRYKTIIPWIQTVFKTIIMGVKHSQDRPLYKNSVDTAESAMAFLNHVLLSGTNVDGDTDDTDDTLELLKNLGMSPYKKYGESFAKAFSLDVEELSKTLVSARTCDTVLQLIGLETSTTMWIEEALMYKRFFQTLRDHLSIGPRGMRKGDLICILRGCSFPVILRKVDSYFVHVGPCFVLGIMDGEATEMAIGGKTAVRSFEIRGVKFPTSVGLFMALLSSSGQAMKL
jgi:hypothetical protein